MNDQEEATTVPGSHGTSSDKDGKTVGGRPTSFRASYSGLPQSSEGLRSGVISAARKTYEAKSFSTECIRPLAVWVLGRELGFVAGTHLLTKRPELAHDSPSPSRYFPSHQRAAGVKSDPSRPTQGREGTTYIVIPTLNEAANLGRLVPQLGRTLAKTSHRIVVVDDGSTDGTQELVESLGREGYRVELLERGKRLGIGSAIRDGLSFCLAKGDVCAIITMDADLSHDPSDIPSLLDALSDTNLVQGSRYASGAQIVTWYWPRRLLSVVANTLVRILLRTGMKEHTTYFRAYSRRAAEAAITVEGCDSYDWALGSLLAVRAHGLPVREVPIVFRERSDGESKLKIEEMLRWLRFVVREGVKRRAWTRNLVNLPRFALVGASGIVVNQALLFLLAGLLGMWPLAALSIGIEASILWNFMLNERWTFATGRTKGTSAARLARYHAVCALGVGINFAVFAVLAMGLNINYLVSNLIAILAAFMANFRGSVSWAWQAS